MNKEKLIDFKRVIEKRFEQLSTQLVPRALPDLPIGTTARQRQITKSYTEILNGWDMERDKREIQLGFFSMLQSMEEESMDALSDLIIEYREFEHE